MSESTTTATEDSGAEPAPGLWFKALVGNKSCHGGTHEWSLPNPDGTPGAWHELPPDVAPVLCSRGFHVTREPAYWFGEGLTAYVAEIAGEVAGPNPNSGDDHTKVAAARCRLLRLATTAELEATGVFVSGSHTAKDARRYNASGSAKVTAYGSSQVTASGSSQVAAYDSSRVTASGSAKVTASGSSQVTAYDSSRVTASGSAKVTAYGSAKVTAYGSSQVTASGSSQVTAYDSSQVAAYGSSQVAAYDSSRVTASGSAKVTASGSSQVTASGSSRVAGKDTVTVVVTRHAKPTVTLEGRAAEVSWASGWAEFRRASGPAATTEVGACDPGENREARG